MVVERVMLLLPGYFAVDLERMGLLGRKVGELSSWRRMWVFRGGQGSILLGEMEDELEYMGKEMSLYRLVECSASDLTDHPPPTKFK